VNEPLRVGLAGAGWVSEHHLDAWSALASRATVIAVADPVRAAAQARASRYAILRVYDSAEKMLEHERLDAIDIAAPREAHASICRAAAQRGVAILCQKPLAPTLAEAEALVADVEPRARLMVHENWRFRPHYRQVHSWIRKGRVGEIRTAVLALLTSGLLPDSRGDLPALVRQPMLAGLERMLLMEVMIHHVDTLRFLLGPLELAGAQLGKRCTAIRGEDRAMLFLRGRGGAAIGLVGDFMSHGYPAEQRDRLEIVGTRGSVVLRDDTLCLAGDEPESITIDLAANYRASYRGAIEHFVSRLADGAPFETSAADNLETLRIVEAAYGGLGAEGRGLRAEGEG
jgi:predicted dehydrogenase